MILLANRLWTFEVIIIFKFYYNVIPKYINYW